MTKTKKLCLDTETVRVLNESVLSQVVGGSSAVCLGGSQSQPPPSPTTVGGGYQLYNYKFYY